MSKSLQLFPLPAPFQHRFIENLGTGNYSSCPFFYHMVNNPQPAPHYSTLSPPIFPTVLQLQCTLGTLYTHFPAPPSICADERNSGTQNLSKRFPTALGRGPSLFQPAGSPLALHSSPILMEFLHQLFTIKTGIKLKSWPQAPDFFCMPAMTKKSWLCCNQAVFSQLITGLQKRDELFSDSLISIAPALNSHSNWFYWFPQHEFDKQKLYCAGLPGFQPISSSVHSGVPLGQSQGLSCSCQGPEGEQQQSHARLHSVGNVLGVKRWLNEDSMFDFNEIRKDE